MRIVISNLDFTKVALVNNNKNVFNNSYIFVGNITLGGAIGTGSHGSTIQYNASISAQVISLTIVDGQGYVRQISEMDDLRAFRLNLGLLGK